jgi:hypothetical protein
MEGFLYLFSDILHVEQKINGNPNYIWILRKKGTDIEIKKENKEIK